MVALSAVVGRQASCFLLALACRVEPRLRMLRKAPMLLQRDRNLQAVSVCYLAQYHDDVETLQAVFCSPWCRLRIECALVCQGSPS